MPIIGEFKPEKKPTLEKQRSYTVAKANDLIQTSKYSMNERESKALLFLISKIKPTDTVDQTYDFTISEFIDVCGISDQGRNYTEAKAALKALADRSIWVRNTETNSEVLLRWLDHVEINQDTKIISVSFHRDMLPYLYDLRTRFTAYTLDNVLAMSSKYSIRLYELLKSYQFEHDKITFTVDELKQRLDANYKRYPDFKRRVLEPAVYDVNLTSDIRAEYIEQRTDNNPEVKYITFRISRPTGTNAQLREMRKQRKLNPEK